MLRGLRKADASLARAPRRSMAPAREAVSMRRSVWVFAVVLAAAAGWLFLRRDGGPAAREGAGPPRSSGEPASAPSLALSPARPSKKPAISPTTAAVAPGRFRFHVVADADGHAVADAEVIDESGTLLGRTSADGTLESRP